MFSLREMQSSDGDAFAALARVCPDTGMINLHVEFAINGYEAYRSLKPTMIGVVAEHPNYDGLVGAAVVSFKDLMLNGHPQNTALLSTLMVHPAVRRQGLAGQLAAWRVQKAREIAGDDVVIYAGIQDGNIGSINNAQKWANQWLDSAFRVAPTKTRQDKPANKSQWLVREASEDEYEIVAEHINRFFGGYNFHLSLSAQKMAETIASTPFDEPIHHYLVIEDKQSNLIAGITVTDTHRLRNACVDEMPLAVKLANMLLKLIPSDGLLKMAETREFWYTDGHEAAAAYLWQMVRYMWRNQASAIRIDYDSRTPVGSILKLSPFQPGSSGMLAVYSPETIDTTRFIHPYL